MPDTFPGVVHCRGGWFAVQNETDSLGSGPWKTREAAEAAVNGDYDRANRLHLDALK